MKLEYVNIVKGGIVTGRMYIDNLSVDQLKNLFENGYSMVPVFSEETEQKHVDPLRGR